MTAEEVPPPHTRWQTVVKTATTFWKDFRERAWSTFWQAFVSTLILAHPTTDWGEIWKILAAAAAGGLAALFSMAKSLWAKNRGVKNSASSNPNV